MTKKKKCLSKKKEEALVPAKTMPRGISPIEEEDRILPRLKLLQALSPEVLDKKGSSGEFVNSISGESFGSKVSFIPLFWKKSRILWKSRDEGGGIICRSFDGRTSANGKNCLTCKDRMWGEEGGERIQPKCTSFINLITLVNLQPLAVSFAKTSYTTGKKFINLLTLKGVDVFTFSYILTSQETTTDKGRFFIMKIDDTLSKVNKEDFSKASIFFERMMELKTEIQIHDEKKEEPEESEF